MLMPDAYLPRLMLIFVAGCCRLPRRFFFSSPLRHFIFFFSLMPPLRCCHNAFAAAIRRYAFAADMPC